MGTNFYGWKKGTYHSATFAVISDESLAKDCNCVESLSDATNIHLGKRSAGWNFVAQMNNSLYYKNKQEYLNFCETLEIRYEYGTLIDFESYKEIVNLLRGKSHLNVGITEDGLEFLNCEFH